MGSQPDLQVPLFDMEQVASIALASYSIAVPIAGFFTGIIFMMYLTFMRGMRTEPTYLKVITSTVVLASIIDFCLGVACLREYTTSSLKNPANALRVLNLNVGQGVVILITILSTQLYFSKVVYLATGANRLCAAVSGFLMACTVAGGVGALYVYTNLAAEGIPDAHSRRGQKMLGLFLLAGCSMAGTFDILVTSVLCRMFFSSKRKVTFGNTRHVLTYLLVTTLETFFLTSATAVSAVVLTVLPLWLNGLAAWKVKMGLATTITIMGRVYAISLLYSLNRRAPLRARLNRPRESFLSGTMIGTNTNLQSNRIVLESGAGCQGRKSPSSGVQIQTEVVFTSDKMDLGVLEKKQPLRSLVIWKGLIYRRFPMMHCKDTPSGIQVLLPAGDQM